MLDDGKSSMTFQFPLYYYSSFHHYLLIFYRLMIYKQTGLILRF